MTQANDIHGAGECPHCGADIAPRDIDKPCWDCGEPEMTHTAKHTPGPWHLSECATQTTRAGIVSVDGLHITDVNGYGMTDSQNQANATLLAAAPAMYLELKEGLVLLEASHHDMVDMYGIDSLQAKTVWERIESTRNALAQAEGRTL